jgi:hypothetical protein
LKFYQQLTGEERRIPFIFDDFHFCRSRVIGLDMTENRKFQNILRNTTQVIIRHRVKIIKSNNSGTEKVKIVKKERDPPLFTSKQLIKF